MNRKELHPLRTYSPRLVVAWAVACLIGCAAVAHWQIRAAELAFTHDAEMLAQSLSRHLQVNQAVLTGFGALFEAFGRVNPRRADRYAQEMLQRYPYIRFLNAAQRTRIADLPALRQQLNLPRTIKTIPTPSSANADKWSFPIVYAGAGEGAVSILLGRDMAELPELAPMVAELLRSHHSFTAAPWTAADGDRGYILLHAVGKTDANEVGAPTPPTAIVALGLSGGALLERNYQTLMFGDVTLAVHLGEADGPLLHAHSQTPPSWFNTWMPVVSFARTVGTMPQQITLSAQKQLGLEILGPSAILGTATLISLLFGLYAMKQGSTRLREREQARHQEDLREREEKLRLLTDALPALISYVDANGYYHLNNMAYEAWFGVERDMLAGQHIADVLGEENYRLIQPQMDRALAGSPVEFDTRLVYPKLGPRHVHFSVVPDRDSQGRVLGVFVLVTDLTERKRSEGLESQMGRILDTSSNEIYVFDAKTLYFIQVNQGARQNLGYSLDELRRMTPVDLKPEFTHAQFEAMLTPLRAGERDLLVFETVHLRKDGSRYPVEARLQLSHAGDRPVFVAVLQDISERLRSEERLRFLANYDELTGLPNRTLFRDRLEHALAHARHDHKSLALLFLDMDDFKKINDTFGHATGDELLRAFAARLKACVRSGDTVARLGGDEFTILLEQLPDARYATQVATKILEALQHPFQLGGHEVFSNTSIGVTLYPEDGAEVETLLKNADAAMYRAKEQGPGRYQFFTTEMNTRAFERLVLENQLRRAEENNEFVLHFQPVLNLNTRTPDIAEALVRWQHPERGLCQPDQFIPVAEERGVILAIGEWVLEAACAELRALQNAARHPARIAVNVSARQFRQPEWVENVARIIRDRAVDPQLLELELTESTLIYDIDATVATLRRLKDLGVRLAVDDFGIGYTSLVYLKRFPLDTVKIDRSFIRDVAEGGEDAAIVDALLAMAHRLRLEVTAEGVETQAQLEFLRERGCDRVQGFLLAQPMAIPLLHHWFSQSRRELGTAPELPVVRTVKA